MIKGLLIYCLSIFLIFDPYFSTSAFKEGRIVYKSESLIFLPLLVFFVH